MPTITVSTKSEFTAAMRNASGGDTILLEDGDYGSVVLDTKYLKTLGTYTSDVTVSAINKGGAKFDSLDLRYANHVNIENIDVEGMLKIWYGSNNIDIDRVTSGEFYLRGGANLSLTNSEASGSRFPLYVHDVKNFNISNNYIHDIKEDLVRIVGDSSGVFKNNILDDAVALNAGIHADMIQIYAYDRRTPHDLTITGNLIYDNPATGPAKAQGIFIANNFSQPQNTFRNVLVADNLISVDHVNSLYLRGGLENVVLRDNTLLGDQWGLGGLIRLPGSDSHNKGITVDGNISRGILDESGNATVGDNHLYGRNPYWIVYQDPDLLFERPDGDPLDWRTYVTAEGSDAAGFGATALLAALRAGTVKLGVGATGTPETPDDDTPDPDPDTPVTELDPIYSYSGRSAFTGAWRGIVSQEQNGALDLDEGTLAVTFNADTLYWRRGIVSLDSAGNDHGFSAWIDRGVLKISFEDGNGRKTISTSEVNANQDHDLVVSFEDGVAKAWLDGTEIGRVQTGMDWRQNDDRLVVGGYNGSSEQGTTSAAAYAFDGDIRELAVYNEGLTASELGLLA